MRAVMPDDDLELRDGRVLHRRYVSPRFGELWRAWESRDGLQVLAQQSVEAPSPLRVVLAYQWKRPSEGDVQVVRDAFYPMPAKAARVVPPGEVLELMPPNLVLLSEAPAGWGMP